jgi:hypothetical protein
MASGISNPGIPDSGMSFGYSMWILVVLSSLALAAMRVHHDWVLVLGSVVLAAIVLSDRQRWPN